MRRMFCALVCSLAIGCGINVYPQGNSGGTKPLIAQAGNAGSRGGKNNSSQDGVKCKVKAEQGVRPFFGKDGVRPKVSGQGGIKAITGEMGVRPMLAQGNSGTGPKMVTGEPGVKPMAAQGGSTAGPKNGKGRVQQSNGGRGSYAKGEGHGPRTFIGIEGSRPKADSNAGTHGKMIAEKESVRPKKERAGKHPLLAGSGNGIRG